MYQVYVYDEAVTGLLTYAEAFAVYSRLVAEGKPAYIGDEIRQ